jgi:hypothetical protein
LSDQLPAGQVTIADLYRELVGMRTDVARALTRIEVIDARNTSADNLDRDHESRIRALEAFRWKMAGIAVVLAIIFGLLSGYLSNAIRQTSDHSLNSSHASAAPTIKQATSTQSQKSLIR